MILAEDVVVVDYSRALADVLIDFAKHEIISSSKLDIITKVEPINVAKLELPSWVLDWSYSSTPHSHLNDIMRLKYRYSAASKIIAKFHFPERNRTLNFEGLNIARIKRLGKFNGMKHSRDFGSVIQSFHSWRALLPKDADGEA